jgi:hypothetical protein
VEGDLSGSNLGMAHRVASRATQPRTAAMGELSS